MMTNNIKSAPNNLTIETLEDGYKSGLIKDDMIKLGWRSLTANEMWLMFRVRARGYIIPYSNGFFRAKLLERYQGKRDKKPRKYVQLYGAKPALYFPLLISEKEWDKIRKSSKATLYFTEGEKKAAAAVKAGMSCIGLGGVWNWKSEGQPLAELDEIDFRNREVYIVFDSDISAKLDVQHAEQAFAAELERRGARVCRIKLPSLEGNNKTGLDDFLVYYGLPNNRQKALAEFEKLPSEQILQVIFPDRYTDIGNARHLVRLFGLELKYIPKGKTWMAYNPQTGLWAVDDAEAMKRAKLTIADMYAEAEKITNKEIRDSALKAIKNCASAHRLKAMIELAASEDGMAVDPDDFDAEPMVLALGNGTVIDLETGKPRSSHPDDLCTRSIGTTYDPDAHCLRWEQFLDEITGGNREMIGLMQRAVGYSLTALTVEHIMFVLYGSGANGKTTFLNIILSLLGSYACQCAPETFMQKKQTGISNDIARLHGARFIATSEVEEGQYLAESLIKQFTGGDKIVARYMYKELFEFEPVGKLFLATNYRPRIRGVGEAMWRRIRLIPFEIQIPESKRDKKLTDKLKAELSGILNWALRGCAEWQQIGLRPPASVLAATDEYQREMDTLGQWLDECCVLGADHKVRVQEAYDSYKLWAEAAGKKYPLDRAEFVRRLVERGFTKKNTTDRRTGQKGMFLHGVGLPTGNSKFR